MSAINISAERFRNLKARIKELCSKRKYYGDLSQFSTNDYDFKINPNTGDIILSEQGVKVINLILNINDVNDIRKIENDNYILRDIDAIEKFVSRMEGQTPTSPINNCRGGCMGICVTHCSTGCVGSCMTSCDYVCGNSGCSGKCVNQCSSCSGTCKDSGCRIDCRDNCTNGVRRD